MFCVGLVRYFVFGVPFVGCLVAFDCICVCFVCMCSGGRALLCLFLLLCCFLVFYFCVRLSFVSLVFFSPRNQKQQIHI